MATADALVYDLSQMTDASPQVFTKRDWLSIQDQQAGNYNGNQCIIDTSQLANSNKYMSYRDAYISMPLVLCATEQAAAAGAVMPGPGATSTSAGFCFGLKNSFQTMIHSMTLDYAGTTIIQQTPFTSLFTTFQLLTTLSLDDLNLNGASIGFYPDDVNFAYVTTAANGSGVGCLNNVNAMAQGKLTGDLAGGTEFSNRGMWERQKKWIISPNATTGQIGANINSLLGSSEMNELYISRVQQAIGPSPSSMIMYQIQAQLFLKHLHPFFSQIPLLKGVFFRLTLNLNQPSILLTQSAGGWEITTVTSPLGGIVPVMVASSVAPAQLATNQQVAGVDANPTTVSDALIAADAGASTLYVTLNVGQVVIDATQKSRISSATGSDRTGLNTSCFLNVPAYTFNPSFEEAYLSRPTKTIMYTDIYQFTTTPVSAGSQFNFLLTNGISNVKSVLIFPFINGMVSGGSGTLAQPQFQNPFDSCGGGTSAPYAALNNFNVVVAGQNMVYNQVQYDYQEFLEQLVGVNSVNGNLVDGLTSGLIDFPKWQKLYRAYYVNTSRMLPIDESVPKSVTITGKSLSSLNIVFYCFIEYGVQVSVDVLTGARV